MKYQLVLTLVLITILKINSYVVIPTKNVDTTTKLPVTNQAGSLDIKHEKRHEAFKTFTSNDSDVYLEDVLFSIKNQNWTEEEQPCLRQTLLLLKNLQNFTLWAVWNWDSISSEPQGILFGNRYHLGNFDECVKAPWYDTHPELRTQYCLADIVLERTDKSVRKQSKSLDPYQSALNRLEHQSSFQRKLNELTWGACVPAVCQPRSVVRLLGILMAHSHLGTAGLRARISVNEPCQKYDESRQYDGLFYAFVGITACLIAICLICTYLYSKKKENDVETIKDEIIEAFCIKRNATDLLKINSSGLDVLYGIRYLTMCSVVLGHQFGMFNGGPISNGSQVDEDASTIIGTLFLHDDVIVDSFFMMSGFLAAAALTKMTRLPNVGVLLLKRYIRLMTAYAVVIFFVSAVYPYSGSGPLWNRTIAAEVEPCRQNWWLSMLMVSNYIDTPNMCVIVSWYIPCDFHFFVITIVLLWFYKSCRYPGAVLAAVVTIAAVAIPGIVNYVYGLPPIQLFTYDFISNPRKHEQFNMTYIKSHLRYAPYLVGFYSGYLYTFLTASGKRKILSQKWSIIGVAVALLVMLFTMISGPLFWWNVHSAFGGAVYAAVNRPLWACAVALLVICCSLGHVPLIKGFLSWYPWVPLSRLAYGLYLTHSVLITRNVFVSRNPQHNDYTYLITLWTGTIFWGTLASFFIWLVVEAPINNLLDICLKRRNQKTTSPRDIRNEKAPTSTEGRFQDNLPSTISYSSKM